MIGLVSVLEKPGDVLKDRDPLGSVAFHFVQFRSQPLFLARGLFQRLIGMLDEARIDHESGKILVAETVVIGSELPAVSGERFGSRLVEDIMIAGHVVKLDGRVEFCDDSQIFGGLSRVAGLVDEVTADDHKGWMETIGAGDRKLEIGGLLRKIAVLGIHSELGVRHLEKKEIGGRGDSRREENSE